jgi:bidirectional [NiFe] hydrogenase diaphorase subunit
MPVSVTINDKTYKAKEGETILKTARREGIPLPTLCYLEGLSSYGACRLCLVEVEGNSKLQPACALAVREGLNVHTNTGRLQNYRKMIVELLFAEGNHVCSVCVSNGNCELQDLAVQMGVDHIRYPYQYPERPVDLTHELFGYDANRCVLCTRCLRTCDEIEGAHTWDLAGRGREAKVITDMNQPWGLAESCTSCGKCVAVCPVGALFGKGSSVAEMKHRPGVVDFLATARSSQRWEGSSTPPVGNKGVLSKVERKPLVAANATAKEAS